MTVSLVFIAHFTYADDDSSVRTAVMSTAMECVTLLISPSLILDRPFQISISANSLSSIHMPQVLFFDTRAVHVLIFPPNNIFSSDLSQLLLFFFTMIASYLYSNCYLILLNQSLLSEVAQAKGRFELILKEPDMAFIRVLKDGAVNRGGARGRIRFQIKPTEGREAVLCEDCGVGIPEFRERLFTRGFGKDHGFGLFLSREILNITVITISEEKAESQGARFVLVPPANGLRVSHRS